MNWNLIKQPHIIILRFKVYRQLLVEALIRKFSEFW